MLETFLIHLVMPGCPFVVNDEDQKTDGSYICMGSLLNEQTGFLHRGCQYIEAFHLGIVSPENNSLIFYL